MPAFQPCFGTRAQIDARPVVNGQFLVATDTGEMFLDIGGQRIALSSDSSSSSGSTDDDDSGSLLTSWSIAPSVVRMSPSVPSGGSGSGVINTPTVLLLSSFPDTLTTYAVASCTILPSASVSGGGAGNGVLNTPTLTLHCPDDDLTTSYSIVEAS